jgi:hypothetical protein
MQLLHPFRHGIKGELTTPQGIRWAFMPKTGGIGKTAELIVFSDENTGGERHDETGKEVQERRRECRGL